VTIREPSGPRYTVTLVEPDFEQSKKPKAAINKAAWRGITVAAVIGSIALAGALVASTTLDSGSDQGKADPLTTLALVLAILAFVVQIFVYVFQTNASNAALQRSEEVNSNTQQLLTEITSTSRATQRVLFTQFDRLLDFVVGKKPAGPPEDHDAGGVVEEEEEGLVEETDEDIAVDPASRDIRGGTPRFGDDAAREFLDAITRAAQQEARPTFGTAPPRSASGEDRRIRSYLRAWPDRDEAEQAVRELLQLSPLGVAQLKRFADREYVQRLEGRPVGLVTTRATSSPLTAQLRERGLVTAADGQRVLLTDAGRRVARVLSAPKADARPDWYDEVLAPLLRPIPTQAE
jgi:uncharacterized membrane protein